MYIHYLFEWSLSTKVILSFCIVFLIAIPPAKISKIATFRKKKVLQHFFVQIKEKHKTRSVPVRIVNTSAFFLVIIF